MFKHHKEHLEATVLAIEAGAVDEAGWATAHNYVVEARLPNGTPLRMTLVGSGVPPQTVGHFVGVLYDQKSRTMEWDLSDSRLGGPTYYGESAPMASSAPPPLGGFGGPAGFGTTTIVSGGDAQAVLQALMQGPGGERLAQTLQQHPEVLSAINQQVAHSDPAAKRAKLQALHDSGMISDADFQQLLTRLGPTA